VCVFVCVGLFSGCVWHRLLVKGPRDASIKRGLFRSRMALIKRDLEIDNWHDLSTSGSFERELLTGSSAPVPGISRDTTLHLSKNRDIIVRIEFTLSFSGKCNKIDYSRDRKFLLIAIKLLPIVLLDQVTSNKIIKKMFWEFLFRVILLNLSYSGRFYLDSCSVYKFHFHFPFIRFLSN